MAYQVFKRTSTRAGEPMIAVASDGRVVFNAVATRLLIQAGIRTALLLWDAERRRVAVKATSKGDKNGFAVSTTRADSASLRAKQFLAHIGWNATERKVIPAIWNGKERMFEAVIPAEHLAHKGGTSE